jgi:hypothetical protein
MGGITMIYAIIQNGIIVNTIVVTDVSFLSNISDAAVELDSYDPMPGIGWTTTDNVNFSPPVTPPGQLIWKNFIATKQNLTHGQMSRLMKDTQSVRQDLMAGNFADALTDVGLLAIDGTILTASDITSLTNTIQAQIDS